MQQDKKGAGDDQGAVDPAGQIETMSKERSWNCND